MKRNSVGRRVFSSAVAAAVLAMPLAASASTAGLDEFTSVEDAREAGIDLNALQGISTEEAPDLWSFSLREMGLAGIANTPKKAALGGEIEFGVNPFFGARGFAHRQWGLGIAYQATQNIRLVAGSLIYRIFSFNKTEPEVRVRVGRDALSRQLALGLNAGMRYPFTLAPGNQWAASVEGGSLIRPGAARVTNNGAVTLWISAGVGYYF